MEKVVINEQGQEVIQIVYPSYTTDLQRGITALMDRCVTRAANCTLGELGYIHRSSLVYSDSGKYHLRVFFDARYATRPDPSNPRRRVPVSQLMDFQNYMFVGDISKAIYADTVAGPDTEDFIDEAGIHSLRVVDPDSNVATSVLTLECNIPVTMAALADVSILDPAFKIIPQTSGNRSENDSAKIVRAIDRDVPVTLTVEYSAGGDVEPYDPEEAIPYLRALHQRMTEGQQTLRNIRREVSRDAKEKRHNARKGTAFSRYT